MQIALTDWLGEVRRDSQPRQPAVFFVPLARRQQQHRQRTMTRIPPELFDDLQPVHPRHVEIEQDDAERIAIVTGGDGVERLRSGLDADRRQAPLAKDVFEQTPVGRVVVHDQHGHAWRQIQIDARRASCRRRLRSDSGAATGVSVTVKWNVLPTPTVLSSQRRPPIIVTSCEQIARPRPVPPYCLVVEPSACLNGSKITRCLSFGMPMPLSATLM